MSNLGLIDWRSLGFNTLWILGLSMILAALSFADYEASQRKMRPRVVLRRSDYQVALNVGLFLFCLGLAGSAATWWGMLAWILLAMAFAYQVWSIWQRHSRPRP